MDVCLFSSINFAEYWIERMRYREWKYIDRNFHLNHDFYAGGIISRGNNTSCHTFNGVRTIYVSRPGYIRVDVRGYFRYQRVFAPLTGPTVYQNVTFTPYVPTGTIIAPVTYRLTVTFTDGVSEQLQNVGLGNTANIDINVTQHNNPGAGVMLAWQDVGGSLSPVIYLLVSE